LSHYRLLEKIGEGGMGEVYRAHDTKLNRDVAIKILSLDLKAHPEHHRRFLREAQAAAAVTHSNIAMVHEIDESDGVTFIVMELVEGRTLRSLLGQRPLLIPEAIGIATDIAEGLARAHQVRVVHRDLKPENIMISSSGNVKILDFGIAKLLQDRGAVRQSRLSEMETAPDSVTREGQLLGTFCYMSPEQARGGAADARSDIFSFGITLYEMLARRLPFQGRNAIETLAEILHAPAAPVSDLNPETPARLEQILNKCLEKDPDARYQCTDELLGDLRALQEIMRTPDQAGSLQRRDGRWLRAGRFAALALLLTVALIALWNALVRHPSPSPAVSASVALLPLVYEGPADHSHLKELLPQMFGERMRAYPGLRLAPYGYSRGYGPAADIHAVARDLGVDWVVEGRLTIRGAGFVLAASTVRGADGRQTWTGRIEGSVSGILGDADRLAVDIMRAVGTAPLEAPETGASRNVGALQEYLKGMAFFEGWDVKKNYLHAAEAGQRALDLDPGFAEGHALLARALMTQYMQTKEPSLVQRAMDSAQRAVTLSPNLPEAHAALGSVQLYSGHSAQAAQAYEEGLRLAPADDDITIGIARAYSTLGRHEEAERMYRRAIGLRPTYWGHYNTLGVFYFRRGRLDEAKEAFRQVIEHHPESATGYANLAAVHVLAGEHSEAAPLLRAALNIDPSPETRNNLGVVYYATGRFEEAAREWQEAAAAGSPNVMRLSNLGDAYRQLGRSSEAHAAYGRAIERGEAQLQFNANDAETRAMVSIALAGIGRCAEVPGQADRALKIDPGNPTFSYYAAVASAICGDRKASLLHAIRAIKGGIKVDVLTNPDLKPLLDDPAIRDLLDKKP
ncbi:MAG TPA: protein kinase, partial [Candidatus Methylomirabilis sp.]|nr:protein kinase [Candidatus Methylomirabilis sp.]